MSAGNLLHNLLLFGRLLRRMGIDVDTGRLIDLLQALEYLDLGRREDVYHAARSLLVTRRGDIPLFDAAFEAFWRRPLGDWAHIPLASPSVRRGPIFEPAADAADAVPIGDEDENGRSQLVVQANRRYSRRDVLRQKDFADLTPEELGQIQVIIGDLVWRLGSRRTRRQRPGTGERIDFRRSLRRGMRQGGEILAWERRQPIQRPRPLVVLADVSGSMERYTRLLTHFLYSLSAGLHSEVEVFVFSTRLTRISRQLRSGEAVQALRAVSRAVPDWSGGTRIGAALRRFNFEWARRVLSRGAVVLLISDGWDRGEPELLAQEVARLQRSCHRLIWLNPLLGDPGYEPLTRGIAAALPYVDDFLPIHNLESLEQLARRLELVEPRPPLRRFSRVPATGARGAA